MPRSRPLILLLNGHSSHYCPSTIRLAAENGIILFALPPHTTHITQPLDKGCFAPLKVVWRQVCHDFCSKNPGRTVSHYDFSRLFSKTWYKAMSAGNIVASFKITGVYPFNRSAIKLPGAGHSTEYVKFCLHVYAVQIFSSLFVVWIQGTSEVYFTRKCENISGQLTTEYINTFYLFAGYSCAESLHSCIIYSCISHVFPEYTVYL